MLQLIIHMIRPPLCSAVPLQMVICKEDGSQDDQNQGDGVVGIATNFHPVLCFFSNDKRVFTLFFNQFLKNGVNTLLSFEKMEYLNFHFFMVN